MSTLTLAATGDLVLGIPESTSFFDRWHQPLVEADVTIGHVEVPHTLSTDHEGKPGLPPERLDALAANGFDIATLAGNHVYDCGVAGIIDTADRLRRSGVAVTGAGRDLAEAWVPAVVERVGASVGVLSINAVGPPSSWATDAKGGCAYVEVVTDYRLDYASPGGTPSVRSMLELTTLGQLRDHVATLRDTVDVVVVSIHKGRVHQPAIVDLYESELGRVAIDAGAHVVLGHHSHILRGIELYRGRPIFHGLGNFVTVTPVLAARAARGDDDWALRRLRLFGFEPDPAMPEYYAFHPDSRHAMLGRVEIDLDSGGVTSGFVPCWIDTDGRPVPAADEGRSDQVLTYVESITRQAGLGTRYHQAEGWVVATR